MGTSVGFQFSPDKSGYAAAGAFQVAGAKHAENDVSGQKMPFMDGNYT
jgi:hypothetical protein